MRKKIPVANWKSTWPTTLRSRYANRARGNAPTIIPGTRATKPSSVEKRVARRQKVWAYGGVAAVAVVDCNSGKKSRTANAVKIRGGPNQSDALCPPGKQYCRCSSDWCIFARIGRYCWIFQIVFLAGAGVDARTKIACRRARSSRTYTVPSSPLSFYSPLVLFLSVRGCGSPPAAVVDKAMLFPKREIQLSMLRAIDDRALYMFAVRRHGKLVKKQGNGSASPCYLRQCCRCNVSFSCDFSKYT